MPSTTNAAEYVPDTTAPENLWTRAQCIVLSMLTWSWWRLMTSSVVPLGRMRSRRGDCPLETSHRRSTNSFSGAGGVYERYNTVDARFAKLLSASAVPESADKHRCPQPGEDDRQESMKPNVSN